MEKIDLNNYEAYFLDYMEGTLSVEEKHDLFTFLEKHPELRAEMEEDFGAIELQPEELVFENKSSLKVDESKLILTPDSVEEHIIASVEGQLTEAHQQQLDTYIRENKLEKTVAYYNATILKPDTSVVYEEKERLKVKTGVVISMPLVARVASIAAVGVILISVAMNWNNSVNTTNGASSNVGIMAESDSKIGLPEQRKVIRELESNWLDNQNEQLAEVTEPAEKVIIRKQEQKEVDIAPLFAQEDLEEAPKDSLRKLMPDEFVPKVLKEELNTDEIANKDKEEPKKENPITPIEIYSEQNDVAMNSIKTEEPYKILTDAASDLINTDISFSRDKNLDSKEYVAYSFKLGKFEFERKKGK